MSNQRITGNKLLDQPVSSLLWTMSVPMMLSMIVQSLYNIVDSMFVARLGVEALTAVSYVFPLQNIVLSLAVGFGVGINVVIAMNLGMGNQEKANQTATLGMALTVLHGLLFIVLGFLVARPFLELFTADEQIIQWGVQYAVIVFTFSMGYLLQISMEKIFQSVGEMMITMVILASGSIINIILDPIFIFGWFGFPALGVAGAAIATVIGQTAAFFFYLIAYKKKKLPVEIHLRYLQWNGQLVWKLYYIGIPAAITMALPSILAGALNKLLSAYGDVYVAVMGIYFKLQTFLYMPSNGIIQGIRPIISCNYGAGRYDRMWETIGRSVAAVAVIMLFGTVLCWLLPEQLMLLFDDDAALVALGAHVLPLISLGFLFSALGVILSGVMEALGRGLASLVLSLLRQMVLTVPLAWLLSNWLEADGIWLSLPLAEGLAFFFAVALLLGLRREQGKEQNEKQ